MTLDTVAEYDPGRFDERRGHAVVLGGSMAGLLAARVLCDRFEAVTVVERDPLSDGAVPRRGIPQARHIHALQRAGQVALEALFPGYSDDLTAAGGLELDFARDVAIYQAGDVLADGTASRPQYHASRPLFEQVTRRRVAALDGVTILDESHCTGYRYDDGTGTVEGVTVQTGGTERDVDASLVVDATGRTSRTPGWLARNGFRAPPVDEVAIDLCYSTVCLERPPGARGALLVLPEAPRTRGAAVFPIEGDRWLLTLAGMHGDHPPSDVAGCLDFAGSLPVETPVGLLDDHALVSNGVTRYPFPSTVRRRYESLDRFPTGLVVLGDAIASVNPIYGQGMSVAALEALQLHHALATAPAAALPLHFFERAAAIVDDAWTLAVGSDFAFSRTTGPRPVGTAVVNRYVDRLLRKAHSDGRLTDAFLRVVSMESGPDSLFRPGVAWRVLRPLR